MTVMKLRILDLATKVKEDPNRTDLGETHSLGHGFLIIKKHAQPNGRYHDPEISTEMDERYQQSDDFLRDSPLQKSTVQLSKEQASLLVEKNRKQLQQQLDIFLLKYPSSDLLRSDFEWYYVATISSAPKPTHKSYGLKEYGFFAASLVVTGVAAYAAYSGITSDDPESTSWLLSW